MNRLTFYLFAYWHDHSWNKFVGATVKIWDLAQNLSSQGHEVVIFLPKYHFAHENLSFRVVEIPFIDLPILRLISFNLFLTLFLFAQVIKKCPQVIYTRRMTSFVPLFYAKVCKAVAFYEINDDPFISFQDEGSRVKNIIRSVVSLKIDELNIKLSSKLFVISNNLIEKIQKWVPGIKSESMVLMPSGANTQLFKPYDKRDCRADLNLDVEAEYVGFIGTLMTYQGIDTLIDAAPSILKKRPRARFVIIGEGPMKAFWKHKVEKKGLATHFRFTGQIVYENVPTYIGAMDICVAPFKKNAGLRSPVKIFDYMACGRAVVASRIQGTTDIFENTGTIALVKPEDPESLADTIIDLLIDGHKAENIGQKGRNLIIQKYDRTALAARITSEAEKLLALRGIA